MVDTHPPFWGRFYWLSLYIVHFQKVSLYGTHGSLLEILRKWISNTLKKIEYEAKLEPLKLRGGGNSNKKLSMGVFIFYGTTYSCFLEKCIGKLFFFCYLACSKIHNVWAELHCFTICFVSMLFRMKKSHCQYNTSHHKVIMIILT